jgi:hypothetical protein
VETNNELDEKVIAFDRKRQRFRLRPFHELTVGSERAYLVKGIIPRVGLAVVWGPPKCGKSFWAFDLAMHVALGREYRGRRVCAGPVVYCAFEGADGFKARAAAFRQHHLSEDHEPPDFYLIADRASLAADHTDMIRAIRAQLDGCKPVCVVLDTLNRSLAGSESDDKDMGAYIRAADAIRDAFGCIVVIVHHCGVEATRPRGHTSLTGAVDAQLAVKRDTAGNVLVTVEWMKDGPEGDIIASRLEPVEVGTDADGDAITSCVVVPADPAAIHSASNRKLSDRHKLGLAALTECILTAGKPVPISFQLPETTNAVTADEWREELFRRGTLDREAKNPRADFKRIREGLQARHLIGQRDGLVWVAVQ